MRLLLCLLIFVFPLYSHASDNVFNIGVSLALNGKYSHMGTMQKRGFLLWEATVNESGGLLGKQVKLHIFDDKSDPNVARELYTDMIEKKKVDLVFGPYSSKISKAILPIVEKHKYPTLLSGASSDALWEQGYKYAFGVYTPASKYTVGFLELLVRNKIKKVAILTQDDPFSRSLSKSTNSWAGKFQLQVTNFEEIAGVKDFVPIAEKIRQANAEALIVCGYFNESVAIRNALKKINWYPKAYYSSVGPATQEYFNKLAGDSHLTFSSSQWEMSVGIHFPMGKEFIHEFKNRYQREPSYHAATAFAAGMILQAAVEKTGSLDRQTLRNTFLSMDTTTLIGRYGVDKTGWQIRHFPVIIQWQNGKKIVVWPESLKTAAPIF